MKAQAAEARADAGEAATKRWQREAEVGSLFSASAYPAAAGEMSSHQLANLEKPHQCFAASKVMAMCCPPIPASLLSPASAELP